MGIKRIVDGAAPQLTATERRLAEVVLRDPARAATSSAASLAAEARAHGASVVRFARKLGFDGFPDLRAALHAEAFTPRDPPAPCPGGPGLGDLVRAETETLAALPAAVTDAQIGQAAQHLARADRIAVAAENGAAVLAAHFADRAQQLGCAAYPADLTAQALARALAGLRPGDAVLAIALTGMPPLLARAMAAARSNGVRVVLLAGPDAAPPCPPADVGLTLPPTQSLLVPMAVLATLLQTLAAERGDHGQAEARYTALCAKLERTER